MHRRVVEGSSGWRSGAVGGCLPGRDVVNDGTDENTATITPPRSEQPPAGRSPGRRRRTRGLSLKRSEGRDPSKRRRLWWMRSVPASVVLAVLLCGQFCVANQ